MIGEKQWIEHIFNPKKIEINDAENLISYAKLSSCSFNVKTKKHQRCYEKVEVIEKPIVMKRMALI